MQHFVIVRIEEKQVRHFLHVGNYAFCKAGIGRFLNAQDQILRVHRFDGDIVLRRERRIIIEETGAQ